MDERRVRVLLAEDDEDISHLLQRLLTLAGVEVRMVGDGAAALALLGVGPSPDGDAEAPGSADVPHCLVLDVQMPTVGGVDVLRTVQAKALGVPVVLLTGSVEPSVRQEAVALGAAAVLRKPFAASELLGAVARAVRDHHPELSLPPPLSTALGDPRPRDEGGAGGRRPPRDGKG